MEIIRAPAAMVPVRATSGKLASGCRLGAQLAARSVMGGKVAMVEPTQTVKTAVEAVCVPRTTIPFTERSIVNALDPALVPRKTTPASIPGAFSIALCVRAKPTFALFAWPGEHQVQRQYLIHAAVRVVAQCRRLATASM